MGFFGHFRRLFANAWGILGYKIQVRKRLPRLVRLQKGRGKNTMRVLRQTRALCMGCIFTAIFAFFTSCGARLSPEAQDVFDRYNKIHQEMTEQDVDAIFNGYSARRVNEVYEADGEGKPLPRPSAYSKLYSPKGAAEFDDVILIHFDRDGRVVGKRRETYIR